MWEAARSLVGVPIKKNAMPGFDGPAVPGGWLGSARLETKYRGRLPEGGRETAASASGPRGRSAWRNCARKLSVFSAGCGGTKCRSAFLGR
jgi:hypothetical protein